MTGKTKSINDELMLNDGIMLDEGDVIPSKYEQVEIPQIEKSIAAKMTQDELRLMEQNKEKHLKKKSEEKVPVQKKTVGEELQYSKDELNSEEMDFSLDLQKTLVGFIKEKVNISESSGVKFLLPTGIDLLDTIAGGGFAAGALTLIVGNPGTFKSALLGQTIGTNQKKYRGKVMNIFMDSEEATTESRLKNLGVTNPPMKPHPARSVEDVFKTIEALCAFKEMKNLQDNPTIVAWDSIANTITEKEKQSDDMDINKFIGLKARIISILLPKYIAKLEQYNIGLIVVNQLREKIDMGFFPTANDLRWIGDKNMPGGNALKYNAFHLLLLKVKGDLKPEEWGFNGVLLEAKFIKNKLFQPNIVIPLVVDFNRGVSNFWTNWQLLVDQKRATASAWCSLKTLPQIKFRKKEALSKYKTDVNFKAEFDRQVKEVLQVEYINKFSSDAVMNVLENEEESGELDLGSNPEQN